MLSVQIIRDTVRELAPRYGVTSAALFGSYADDTATAQSDVDLLLEFDVPGVSLLKLSEIKYQLQDLLGVAVDVIHGPLPQDSLLLPNNQVSLYKE